MPTNGKAPTLADRLRESGITLDEIAAATRSNVAWLEHGLHRPGAAQDAIVSFLDRSKDGPVPAASALIDDGTQPAPVRWQDAPDPAAALAAQVAWERKVRAGWDAEDAAKREALRIKHQGLAIEAVDRGHELARLRKIAGLTLPEMAVLSGIGDPNGTLLSKLERGLPKPAYLPLQVLMDAYRSAAKVTIAKGIDLVRESR